jgi:pyruvate dehydrogenase E2 component (dihydrolipoamide acetyltransferase)
MATKVHMEALSPTMEEGQLVKWLKQEGDAVKEGDVLAEIETDKATMELVARGSGVLQGVKLKEGRDGGRGRGHRHDRRAGEGRRRRRGSATDDAGGAAPRLTAGEDARTGGRENGRRTRARSATRRGSEQSGRPERQESKTPAAEETGSRESAKGAEPKEAGGRAGTGPRAGAAGPTAAEAAPRAGSRRRRWPGAWRRSGHRPGRAWRARAPAAASRSRHRGGGEARVPKQAVLQATAKPTISVLRPRRRRWPRDGPDSEEVPVTQMRKTIAKRLAQSIGPIPTFYLTIECDMTRLMELREQANQRLERDGVKASINDFVIKAVAEALKRHPEVNASWGDGHRPAPPRAHRRCGGRGGRPDHAHRP